MSAINFEKDGIYDTQVEGELTIKGITKPIEEKGTITVQNGKIKVATRLNIVLADYGITFSSGKPSTNIAKEIEVTVEGEYEELES